MKALLFIFSILSIGSVCSQSHYPGQHSGKFAVQDQMAIPIQSFDLDAVQLLDGRFKQNMEREEQWVNSIDANRLLHSFRTNAGVTSGKEGGYMTIKKLAGWESLDCELRGHTTGHFLSGLAFLYASTGKEKYKLKADSIVKGLAEVQLALNRDGYLSAFPEELINRNIAGKSVWAPWYTLHKILAGLLDQYLYCGNRQALETATKMGDWAYKKLLPLTAEQRTKMLRNEFGGINECFYNLYTITGKTEYKWLTDFFYHNETLDPLQEQKDVLNPKHANTYIPKLIGLTRVAEVENKKQWDTIAAFFWKTVVGHHSFATGSNSDKEHFFQPDSLSRHLTGYTGESCNVYNMLKLTRHLYMHSGNTEYLDYYEKALFNHILGQQDVQTGMVAYFLPLKAGSHKVYSTPDSSFWCCVGSGFENQAKYGEAIYYHNTNDIFVNLFIASSLKWKEKNIVLKQSTSFPYSNTTTLTIDATNAEAYTLNIRYPSWCSAMPSVTINGKKQSINANKGQYISFTRKWQVGDRLEVSFPMSLNTVPTNDNMNIAAFTYGPIVLAGEMGTANFTGRQPFSDPNKYNDYYTYDYHVPSGLNDSLEMDMNKLASMVETLDATKLQFRIKQKNITLRPLFDIHQERYIVYWNFNNQ